MKGIILAGGSGSRLYPITLGTSKQLLPIYDKPMIYYPLSVLMLAGIKDILIIVAPEYLDSYKGIIGDGSDFGVTISYEVQEKPEGISQAFIIGENFIGNDCVCLILGDNIFYGRGFTKKLISAVEKCEKDNLSTVFAYEVNNPEAFGIVDFDEKSNALSIEEKPTSPKSNYAVTGLYFYNNSVIDLSKKVVPSERGELEISSINQMFLDEKKLNVELLGRGFAWLDTGTNESLLAASQFVETIETAQGFKIACLEEIAYNKGWLDKKDLEKRANLLMNSSYGRYLKGLI